MAIDMRPDPDLPSDPLCTASRGAFAQPGDQALPHDLLALLVALDRAKRERR